MKSLNDKWRRRSQELHRHRLKNMKADVDNAPPKRFAHLASRKKKEQLLMERYRQIERENRILLEKMAEIMGRPLRQPKPSEPPIRSLNSEARRRRLQKITEENQQILKRIQASAPNYDHREWEQHWQEQQGYLRNMCQYPWTLLGEGSTPTPPSHSRSQASLRRASSPGKTLSDNGRIRRSSDVGGRRRKKSMKSVKAKTSGSVLLREGRNINGTYVIVTVCRRKRKAKTWEFKVYEPQFSDEVEFSVPVDVLASVALRNMRPELLEPANKAEFASFALEFLRVETSEDGTLLASFAGATVTPDRHVEEGELNTLLSSAAAHNDSYESEPDEFGTAEDLKVPEVPQPQYTRENNEYGTDEGELEHEDDAEDHNHSQQQQEENGSGDSEQQQIMEQSDTDAALHVPQETEAAEHELDVNETEQYEMTETNETEYEVEEEKETEQECDETNETEQYEMEETNETEQYEMETTNEKEQHEEETNEREHKEMEELNQTEDDDVDDTYEDEQYEMEKTNDAEQHEETNETEQHGMEEKIQNVAENELEDIKAMEQQSVEDINETKHAVEDINETKQHEETNETEQHGMEENNVAENELEESKVTEQQSVEDTNETKHLVEDINDTEQHEVEETYESEYEVEETDVEGNPKETNAEHDEVETNLETKLKESNVEHFELNEMNADGAIPVNEINAENSPTAELNVKAADEPKVDINTDHEVKVAKDLDPKETALALEDPKQEEEAEAEAEATETALNGYEENAKLSV